MAHQPGSETVEVLKLAEESYERVDIYGRGDIVTSSVLPDFTMPVDTIFEEG